MYRLREDPQRPPGGPGETTLRVGILGAVALVMFAVIFLRLWYLEILSGDRYLQQANDNRIREIRVQGPRGEIVDRNSEVLVDNRTVLALQIDPRRLPASGRARDRLLRRLADVVDANPSTLKRDLHAQLEELPGNPATLNERLTPEQIYFLREHQSSFPGITVETVFVRHYTKGTLGAHLFGNVGEVTEEQLSETRYQGLAPGDVVGQSGIEFEYDRFLRGRSGATRVQVDALGRPKGEMSTDPAEPGDNVRLTIDSSLQTTGEAALGSFGLPGAFVAMEVDSGEVLAQGSFPTFDPAIFTRPLPKGRYKALTSEENNAPLANRAIQGLYPTGSVFKLITALAAVEEELITPTTPVFDGGAIKVDTITFKNAGDAVYGTLDLIGALKVSSDVYFYKLGLRAPAEGDGGPIQDWARRLGLGSKTGIDLPAEVEGLVPTPEWRNRLYAEGGTDRPWTAGDNINLSVGQGDLQANPLQMAVAYAALANGGDVVRPHIVQRVEDVSGRALQEVAPPPRRHVEIDDATRQAILDGLHLAAMERLGTSYEVFGNFPVEIAGKTGTAERGVLADQSWYVALAPYDDPEIVVAVTVEQGGFGVDTAAPIAAQILADHFNVKLSGPPADAPDATTLE